MRPTPVKFEDAEDATPTMPQKQQQQQQQQQQQAPTKGSGAAFSPTRRVGARGGPQLFAQKLFTLVEEEDSDIVEWLPDGLAFRVKDIQRFSCEVLEKYFNRESCVVCVYVLCVRIQHEVRILSEGAYLTIGGLATLLV